MLLPQVTLDGVIKLFLHAVEIHCELVRLVVQETQLESGLVEDVLELLTGGIHEVLHVTPVLANLTVCVVHAFQYGRPVVPEHLELLLHLLLDIFHQLYLFPQPLLGE